MKIKKVECCSKYSMFVSLLDWNLEMFTYHKEVLLWVNICLGS